MLCIINLPRFEAGLALHLVLTIYAVGFAQQQPPVPVAVIKAVEQEVAAAQTFVATVLPEKRAIVGSAVAGRVVELAAHEGERVNKQQPLVKLLTGTIELELKSAEAELNLRAQQLLELENGSRPNEIEQSKAQLLGAKIALEYAKSRLDRRRDLRSSQAISQDELDDADTSLRVAIQTFYELKAAHEMAVEGPRTEKIEQARAQVAIQKALIDQIEDRITKYTLFSRFDGYVVAEYTEEGAWVKVGDPVMEVVALDQVEVRAFVAEQHVAHIHPGMNVRVEVPALANHVFTGVITTIVPQSDARAKTFPVNIRVINEIGDAGPLLKSGMVARVALPTGQPQKGIMVPKDALVLGGPQTLIYVVQQRESTPDTGDNVGTATPVSVELGVATPNLIQVVGDLKPGQSVVVEGNERLRPGQDVIIARVVPPPSAESNSP